MADIQMTLISAKDQQGRALWRLNRPFTYRLGPGSKITVPKFYVTNFGTIPRMFYWFVSPTDLREASLVHDWMCGEDFVDDGIRVNSGYSRWIADCVLYEILRRLGFKWWSRIPIFAAVRVTAILSGKI